MKKTAVETLTFWGKIPMKKISNKHVISNGMSYGSSYLRGRSLSTYAVGGRGGVVKMQTKAYRGEGGGGKMRTYAMN